MTVETILQHLSAPRILDVDDKFIPIDLSANNPEIAGLESAAEFEDHINQKLSHHRASAAYGGYGERRTIYKRSELFIDEDEARDIHIGIDLWAPENTVVLAPITGTVHSFDYNTGLGNYGPTIILEHKIENIAFYTLYGHLTIDSIAELELGDIFGSGQPLGRLGGPAVNGDYAPHLHFQIIKDIDDYEGDYPGVCSEAELEHYLSNCPDPNLLLKLNEL